MKSDKSKSFGTLFAGVICFLMGIIVLGAQFGFVPADEGAFFAPPPVIIAIVIGLLLLALVIWIPQEAPVFLRAGMGLVLVLMLAVVCNWSAFAPNVRYTSNLVLGPISSSSEDLVGGRIVFGIAALAIDLLLLGSIFWVVKKIVHRIRQ